MLEYVDYINLLAVNPGFGGQQFIPNVLDKIRQLGEIIVPFEKEILIQSDGGIKRETIGEFSAAGVNSFVIGSAIFDTEDYRSAINELKEHF